ncbi:hypothetical protein MUK42_24423 [Musa troglodytarum]|uniref:Uncharacterized protein n=1 Tax=Musa troglodytarum TaxID=320322 RepID=A0A9E7G9W1_9LILI|nr:hypothetical protein MUK42_24423 [Musa troglodytarum]
MQTPRSALTPPPPLLSLSLSVTPSAAPVRRWPPGTTAATTERLSPSPLSSHWPSRSPSASPSASPSVPSRPIASSVQPNPASTSRTPSSTSSTSPPPLTASSPPSCMSPSPPSTPTPTSASTTTASTPTPPTWTSGSLSPPPSPPASRDARTSPSGTGGRVPEAPREVTGQGAVEIGGSIPGTTIWASAARLVCFP